MSPEFHLSKDYYAYADFFEYAYGLSLEELAENRKMGE
jgi:hypothetical protein